MAGQPSRFLVLDGVAAALAAAPTLIFGVAILCQYVHVVHELLELLSFAATAVLAATAIAAIAFASTQADEARRGREEAENNRLTGIYMTIAARWNADDLYRSRLNVLSLRDAARERWLEEGRDTADTAGRTRFEREYIRDSLMKLRNRESRAELRRFTLILQFLEDVGTLCRNRYVRSVDVFDLFGSSIEIQVECLELFIFEARKPENGGSPSVYANTIYLYRNAKIGRTERYTEPKWPLNL